MGLLGYMIGGALQGAGEGITNEAIVKRTEALEAEKARAAKAASDLAYQRQQADRTQTHDWSVGDATTAYERSVASKDIDYQHQGGLLAIGAGIKKDEAATQHGYTMEEIGARHVNDVEMATLNSQLSEGRTTAEINLRHRLDSGDFSSVVKGSDGTYYGVTKNGMVPTGVGAPPDKDTTGTEKAFTEGQIDSLYQDAHRDWVKGGKKGAEPTRTQFILGSRKSKTAEAPDPSDAPVAPTPQAQALAQLGTVYANATPDRYPGLFVNGAKIPMAQAIAQVKARYK